jgi:hemerythrin superfamily protein
MAMKGSENIVEKVGQMLGMEDKPKDAVEILKADHRKVESLFAQFEKARTANKKQDIVNQIIKELTVHASCEEDFVYPILEDIAKTEDGAKQAYEEHHLIKLALIELADTPMTSESLKAKVMVIKEMVKRHFKEEESVLLPQLKRSGTDLQRLANQIMQRKQQLMGGIKRGGGVGKNKVVKAHAASASTKSRSVRQAKTSTAKPERVREVKAAKTRPAAAKKAGTKSASAKSAGAKIASAKSTSVKVGRSATAKRASGATTRKRSKATKAGSKKRRAA